MQNGARVADSSSHGGCIANGAVSVFINGLPAALAGVSVVSCAATHGAAPVACGSSAVFIEGCQAARLGDITGCGAVIISGSGNVFIG